MKKNTAGQFIDVEMILRADGTDGTGLTVTARVKKDGAAWAAGGGAVTEGENGSYQYAPTQAETDANHVVFKFTATGAITQLINVYPIDVAEYKADVSNLDVAVSTRMPTTHINATGGKVDAVGTVDVTTTNSDMRGTDGASTHTAEQAGTDAASKVLATPANLLATDAGGAVTTTTASQDASKADVSALATQAELDNVPKKGAQTWTHSNGEVATVTIAQA